VSKQLDFFLFLGRTHTYLAMNRGHGAAAVAMGLTLPPALTAWANEVVQ
jgi:hypothetical protein